MQLKTSVKPGNLNCEAIMLPKAPPCYTDCMFRYPVPLLWFHLPFLHKSSLLINASLPKRHAFFRPFPLVMWDCANIMFPGASAETSNTNAATFMQNRADEREKHIQGFFFRFHFFHQSTSSFYTRTVLSLLLVLFLQVAFSCFPWMSFRLHLLKINL